MDIEKLKQAVKLAYTKGVDVAVEEIIKLIKQTN